MALVLSYANLQARYASRGAHFPSTSEGFLGHLCPEQMPMPRDNAYHEQGWTQPSSSGQVDDLGNCHRVLGRYAMDMDKDALLGEGSFSICRRAADLLTRQHVAIKSYKVGLSSSGEKACEKFMRQVAMLQELQEDFVQLAEQEPWHRYVTSQNPSRFFVQLLDFSQDASGIPGPDPDDGICYIVTELAEESLKDYLRSQRSKGVSMTRQMVCRLACSVVSAAAALHAKGYVHLDLKPENIMIFNGHLKIIDVEGCVRIGTKISLQDSSSSFSPCYCAPELARFLQTGGQYEIIASASLDAWSIGLTICECATLCPVMRPAWKYFLENFGSAPEAHAAFINWLASLETSPVPECVVNFDAELGEFLSQGLMACDPKLRLSPAQCLSSQYISAA